MEGTRGRKGGRDAGQTDTVEKSNPDDTMPSEREPPGAGADDAEAPPPSDKTSASVKEEVQTAEGQGGGGGSAAGGASQGEGGVASESPAVAAAAATAGDEVAADAAASEPGVSERTDDEEKAVSQEAPEQGSDGEAKTPGASSPAGTSNGDHPKDGDGGDEGGRQHAPADPAAPSIKLEQESSSEAKPGTADTPAAKLEPSEATEEVEGGGRSRQPGGDGMIIEEDGGDEATAVVAADSSSSSDEEDDGFRVVVGREATPAVTPAVPTKRFLRGTNTLVNTTAATASGTAGTKDASGGASSTKPVSAAAGLASLVPSKGAPVAAARPSLKPGEYPPTAELQQSRGRTAFDVDIDGLEEQPWRYPGVDIADFFNYGFTEDSWRVYCEKQLRNRYDRTVGRSKMPQNTGGRGGSKNSSHMRHGGPGRMENSLQVQRPPIQMHSNNNNNSGGAPGPNGFRPQGMAGNGGNKGPCAGGGGGGGRFGPGPPSGHGNASPPWFDGQQQTGPPPQQQQQQMREQHRQNFGPGSRGGQGRGGVAGGGGRGMGRPIMGNGNNGMMADDSGGGVRGSRSPTDPRDEQRGNKMARLR